METGLTYSGTVQVNSTNTALALGSGDMEVFATPALVALMENAAMNAVKPVLPEGSTTVGAMIQTSHLKPSGLNEEVTATAELTEIEGRKLTFKVSAAGGRRYSHPLHCGQGTFLKQALTAIHTYKNP